MESIKPDTYAKKHHTKLQNWIVAKLRFAATSAIATVADHAAFIVLVAFSILPFYANLLSQGLGMCLNFGLQKKFVFTLRRKLGHAFLLSMTFSLGGLLLGSLLVHALSTTALLSPYPYPCKAIATVAVFFYNFYTKRFAFEKSFS